MNDYTGMAALVTAVATLIGSITAFIVVLRRLTDIKHTVNSLSDKRVDESHKAGETQGRLSEKQDQQTRRDIREGVQASQPQNVTVVNPPD